MTVRFEWDVAKANANLSKHDVSFDEAQTVSTDDFSIIKADPDHSDDEERLLILGSSKSNRLLVVSYTEREEAIRLISAPKATRHERRQYEADDDG